MHDDKYFSGLAETFESHAADHSDLAPAARELVAHLSFLEKTIALIPEVPQDSEQWLVGWMGLSHRDMISHSNQHSLSASVKPASNFFQFLQAWALKHEDVVCIGGAAIRNAFAAAGVAIDHVFTCDNHPSPLWSPVGKTSPRDDFGLSGSPQPPPTSTLR